MSQRSQEAGRRPDMAQAGGRNPEASRSLQVTYQAVVNTVTTNVIDRREGSSPYDSLLAVQECHCPVQKEKMRTNRSTVLYH